MTRSWRAVCAVVALALLLSACGQKPGVHSVGGAARFASATEGNDLDVAGAGSGGELAAGVSDGTTSQGTLRNTTSTGGTKTGGRLPTQTQNDPNDRVGITKTTIKIGFHAPLTGAAAIDLNDLRYGNDTYARWLESKGVDIFGRKTQVVFEDDQYSPSVAVAVCRKLVEQDGVFLLLGGAGTDQIQACARYAYSKRIPYLSAGVTEQVVNKLPNYLAFSMSYPAQAAPLAKLIKTFDASAHGGAGGKVLLDRCNSDACAPDPRAPAAAGGSAANSTPKVAIIYSNTEGFYDARDAFVRAMGSDTTLISITKYTISSSEASSVVTQLKSAGIDVVYVLTSPTNFGNILSPAEQQGYRPRWVGVGLTMGINLVAAPACGRQRTTFENAI
ncbi:MAG TPA: ABC transporter substrate-binding protein, partial [Actinomycetota bacterium]|nr:ABC transporter substrate-binding protein [Actinomycetota bacterium]